jgi:hypothetical protein
VIVSVERNSGKLGNAVIHGIAVPLTVGDADGLGFLEAADRPAKYLLREELMLDDIDADASGSLAMDPVGMTETDMVPSHF